MFRLLIERKDRQPQVFRLLRETTTIGRGKDTDLLLPDISVSRHHAAIEQVNDDTYDIIDSGSQNGTKVNGKTVKKQRLKSGDQIQIGKFLIIFERKVARSIEGGARTKQHSAYNVDDERTGFLRKISALDGTDAHSTTQLTPEELEQVRHQIRLLENARIEVADQPQDSWLVGEKGLRFGKGGVPTAGMGMGGSAAIRWSGKAHYIEKLGGLFFSISVNGKGIKKATKLAAGDLVAVGKTTFRYRV